MILGLRYGDVIGVLELYGLNRPEIWDGLRVLEHALIEEESANAKKHSK